MQVKCKSNENTNSIIKAKIAIMIVRSGRRGRGFESRHLDQIKTRLNPLFKRVCCLSAKELHLLKNAENC